MHTEVAGVTDDRLREHVRQRVHLSSIELVRGREYVVFGIIFQSGIPWFYLCDEAAAEYPIPYCAVFFGLELRLQLPSDWVLHWDGQSSFVLPRWWAESPNFLERLLADEKHAKETFIRERAAMESGNG